MGATSRRRAARFAAWHLAACCFLTGQAVAQQETLNKDGDTTTFGTAVVIPSGLRGDIYYLQNGAWKLPNFD